MRHNVIKPTCQSINTHLYFILLRSRICFFWKPSDFLFINYIKYQKAKKQLYTYIFYIRNGEVAFHKVINKFIFVNGNSIIRKVLLTIPRDYLHSCTSETQILTLYLKKWLSKFGPERFLLTFFPIEICLYKSNTYFKWHLKYLESSNLMIEPGQRRFMSDNVIFEDEFQLLCKIPWCHKFFNA